MTIQFHNTLTGRKEPLRAAPGEEVKMYVCGITPYDASHVGHARVYVVFDIVRRVLQANGFRVRFVQNFTDVDDKIIARAQERGVTTTQLAQENIDDFFHKMDALGVQRATIYPRVTDHIPDIKALIGRLIEKKAAYVLGSDVYFSVRDWPSYGKLSKRSIEELESGARVEVNEKKRDPLDFALWKGAKPGEPAEATWDSPWGPGRPGWHIECSVMALKHLGSNFHIHGGGLDLIFPHHENEIAQSEAATGSPFVQSWIHNGFVTVNKEKMSKSLGNFFTLSEVFAKYHPSVVRYMLLSVHYRSPLDFSQDLLEQSRSALNGMKDAIARATRVLHKHTLGVDDKAPVDPKLAAQVAALSNEFQAALADDFNTPGALGVLHRLLGQLEKQFTTNTVPRAAARLVLDAIRRSAELMGFDLFSFMQDIFIPAEVTELCRQRESARQSKNWLEADRLRQAMLDRGYAVEDTAQGPRVLPKAGV